MYELLCEFEEIVVLKTLMNRIDLNFLSKENLEDIAEYIDENGINIDLEYVDMLESLYNSQYDEIEDIYYSWFESINKRYNDVKNGLLKLI